MALLGSLRSRVFAATALVAVLPIAAALIFVTRRVSGQAEAELRRGLDEAVRMVTEQHRNRLEFAAERAALIADLPTLKAAVDTADPSTVEQVAREIQKQVSSDVFVVVGRGGRKLAVLGTRDGRWSEDRAPFRVDGGRLLETFEVPIVMLGSPAPEVLGRLTLGFALDDVFAGRLRDLTGSEVAVLDHGRVFASTLPRDLDGVLLAGAPRQGLAAVDLRGAAYVAAPFPLSSAGEPRLVVLRSRAEVLRPVRTLRTAVAAAAMVAIVASVLLSWALARTVTRPMAALTAAMKDIAATGDLARKIAPAHPWDDEDARLLSSTFGTLTASIARFQREAALRDRLSALGRLSTVIAHEVRNPLMIIKGALRSLKREGASAEVREAAADIEQQVARLNRVVGDVLDFARPLRIEPAPVEVQALLAEAGRAVLADADGLLPRLAVEPSAGTIVTDGERLRAVLVNLLENARDSVLARAAADPSGAASRREIEVGACRVDGRVRLWVEDQGTGIAAADLPKLYEPYFTTKRTGTGLGLAIVRKVVEALGGSIHIDSREGVGTRVEIDLPPALPASAEVP